MNKIILSLLVIQLIYGCSSQPMDPLLLDKMRADEIQSIIKKEGSFLSTLDAVYLVTYFNSENNFISSNDIYMRVDSAHVYHGFDLEKVKVTIQTVAHEKILQVILPLSEPVALDRKTIHTSNTHESYKPKDNDGHPVDVESELTKQVHEVDKKNRTQTEKEAKRLAEQYFELLARKFGLTRAEVQFSS